jgi:hypothetical protein
MTVFPSELAILFFWASSETSLLRFSGFAFIQWTIPAVLALKQPNME